MTKILLTALVADMRNSMAGTTFSKGRYGNYMKTKSVPVKRDTSYQNQWRQTQSYFAKLWRTLSEEQRIGWVNATSNFPTKDKFGNTIFLSAFNLFLKLNLSSAVGGAYLGPTTAPVPVAVPTLLEPTFSVSWNAVELQYDCLLTWNVSAAPLPCLVLCYITQPGSAGKMTMGKTKYFIAYVSYDRTIWNVGGLLQRYFGNPDPGQKAFFEFIVLVYATGQRSSPIATSTIFPPKT